MHNRNLIFIFLNVLIIIISFGLIFFLYSDLPPRVPLFYSLPWGESELAGKFMLLILPGISLVFFVFNLWFSGMVKFGEAEENVRKSVFLKDSFIFVSFFVSVVNLITLIKIVGLFI